MNIVLKENEWAKQMIDTNNLGHKPSETLCRVARYYMDEGYSTREVRERLESFLLKCDSNAAIPLWQSTLDFAMRRAKKCCAANIDFIPISDTEMKSIDALDGVQIRRLAFTLLCVAKYKNIISPKNDSWVNSKDSSIMSLANINTSTKRKCAMFGALREAGMLQFAKRVDNTNVKVLFIEDGETILQITDFRNLGYQYLMYHGEPYFECICCGITAKIKHPENNSKPKYCPQCASNIHTRQTVNSVMRRRANNKNNNTNF